MVIDKSQESRINENMPKLQITTGIRFACLSCSIQLSIQNFIKMAAKTRLM